MDIQFRTLQADEIEVRVAKVFESGCSLLLYKDARCDMNLLDETVSAKDWQRRHYDCKGNLFCSVGIKVDNEWIWKDDCGEESNASAEKGEASDSFKRACVNWGIGRELYTAPFIWVKSDKVTIYKNDKGKLAVKEKLYVEKIAYNEARQIVGLAIAIKGGERVCAWQRA